MQVFNAQDIDAALSFPALVDVLADAFRSAIAAPPRHHQDISLPGRPDATLLLMPAWRIGDETTRGKSGDADSEDRTADYIGVKTIVVIPDNGARGLAAVQGSYLLLSGVTGQPLAMMDAPRLTNWRTAAASALASKYLSRLNSTKLLMVGAGGLAPFLIRAHASVRPITSVTIWNRTETKARACANELREEPFDVAVTQDIEDAAGKADIISVATLSSDPLIRGAWLQPGVHLDTVGAFRPDMRETDDDVLHRARVFVDTRKGALSEAGDIVQPLNTGVIGEDAILGDLFDLTGGHSSGRGRDDEITYFKSVGASLEDLAAAIAIYRAV